MNVTLEQLKKYRLGAAYGMGAERITGALGVSATEAFHVHAAVQELLFHKGSLLEFDITMSRTLDFMRLASHTPKANWKPTNRSPKKLARLKHSLTQSTIQKYATICSHH